VKRYHETNGSGDDRDTTIHGYGKRWCRTASLTRATNKGDAMRKRKTSEVTREAFMERRGWARRKKHGKG